MIEIINELINIEYSGILSIIIFLLFLVLILLVMFFISSYLAAAIMLILPIALLVIMPQKSIGFLAYEQAEFLNGMVIINNLHILLFIWSTLLGIILYTEFISWYISKDNRKLEIKMKQKADDLEITTEKKPGHVNIPFKSIERLLQKFEKIIKKK